MEVDDMMKEAKEQLEKQERKQALEKGSIRGLLTPAEQMELHNIRRNEAGLT